MLPNRHGKVITQSGFRFGWNLLRHKIFQKNNYDTHLFPKTLSKAFSSFPQWDLYLQNGLSRLASLTKIENVTLFYRLLSGTQIKCRDVY